ncbi:hypothetical protein [Nesterenkonia pannonica]|uniref:hypothetical protein n=1 Tax=Nesterenkonia pannonica TaxID=1548602 RepID=UPI00216403ED|nr:hypothetical protein [Nesterenkonia pannonica]
MAAVIGLIAVVGLGIVAAFALLTGDEDPVADEPAPPAEEQPVQDPAEDEDDGEPTPPEEDDAEPEEDQVLEAQAAVASLPEDTNCEAQEDAETFAAWISAAPRATA